MFKPVDTKQSFPKLEEEVLCFWKENDIFRKSVESRPEDKAYIFFEGGRLRVRFQLASGITKDFGGDWKAVDVEDVTQ